MNKKIVSLASIVAIITFVAFAGFTALSVVNVSDSISRSSFAGKDGVPKVWSGATFSSPVAVNTEIKNSGDHLVYLTAIENKSDSSDLLLTDLASRISDSKHAGFISFDANSLEYSYSKNDPHSWKKVDGVNNEGSYQLNDAIHLGASSSSSSKVYLRYNLSPEIGNVTDKISFRLQDNDGNYSVATSESSIAFEETATEIVAVENGRKDDDSGESAFAEPLGVSSEPTDLSAISTSSATLAIISPESVAINTIIAIAILGVFAGCLVAFLVFKPNAAKKATVKRRK